MVYTNNVPQGNQQISVTQPLIQANFGFLDTGIGQEHNFNAAGTGSDMHHLKASMPNTGGTPTKPAGTNGVYFIDGGEAKFLNDTGAVSQLSLGLPSLNGYQWIGQVLVQWGQVTSTSSSFQTQLFNIPFPTACFSIYTQLYGSGTVAGGAGTIDIRKSTITNANFQWAMVTNSSQYTGFFWVAIGN